MNPLHLNLNLPPKPETGGSLLNFNFPLQPAMRPLSRLRAVFTKPALDADFDEELAQHLAAATEDNVRAGMTPAEARRRALIALGGLDQTRELHRDARGLPWLENLLRDLRYAERSLGARWGSAWRCSPRSHSASGPTPQSCRPFYALVYKPLPFHEPERLVSIANAAEKNGGAKLRSSVAQYLDFKVHADRFEGFGYYGVGRATLG